MEPLIYGAVFVILIGLILLLLRSSSGDSASAEKEIRSVLERAALLKSGGDLDQSEVLYERVLSLLDARSKPDEALVCGTLQALAEVEEKSGKVREAREHRSRMIGLWREALSNGREDFLIEIDLMCLNAEFGASTRDVADYYEKLLAHREKTANPNSPVFVNTVVIYSRLLRRLGEDQLADDLEHHAEKLRRGGDNRISIEEVQPHEDDSPRE